MDFGYGFWIWILDIEFGIPTEHGLEIGGRGVSRREGERGDEWTGFRVDTT
jgi:hypothetical protein